MLAKRLVAAMYQIVSATPAPLALTRPRAKLQVLKNVLIALSRRGPNTVYVQSTICVRVCTT